MQLEKLVVVFSRYHKHTLSTEMHERSRAVLLQLLRANNAVNALQRRNEFWHCAT